MVEGTEESSAFELEGFDPETGHRHDCRRLDSALNDKGFSEEKCERCGWVMGHPPLNCQNDNTPHLFPSQLRCDCAGQLYAIAAARVSFAMTVEKLGPIDGDHVLVVHGKFPIDEDKSFGDVLVEELVRLARARGAEGPIARHVPLVVCLAEKDQSISVLGEKEMNKNGWYRRGMGAPIPAGPYS